MKIHVLAAVILSAAVGCTDGVVVQSTEDQPSVSIAEARPGLSDLAQVSGARAVEIARAQFSGGNVVEAELEDEDGVLAYEIEVKIPGEPGIQEIVIDATTGEILSTEVDMDDDENDDEDEEDDDGDDDEVIG